MSSLRTMLASITAPFSAPAKDRSETHSCREDRAEEHCCEEEQLRREDPWFHEHYVSAADVVASKLRKYMDLNHARLFDFGCGDGIMSLGVNRRATVAVTGFDLTEVFLHLPDKALNLLRLEKLPETLRFVKVAPGKPLPFADGSFDAGYSWSVFEHVADVDGALAEAYRILKPRAPFFLQIEPLFASPFGSHLQRLIDEPWAHLLTDEESYLERTLNAKDSVPDDKKDTLYRKNEFDAVKKYLVGEYRTLNRITVDQLLSRVLRAGFHIREMETVHVRKYEIPQALLEERSEYDLRTNEIQLVITK